MSDPFKNDKDTQRGIDRAGHYVNEASRGDLTKDQLLKIDQKLSGWYSFLQIKASLYLGEANYAYWHRSIEYSKKAIKKRKAEGGKDVAQNKCDHLAKSEVGYEIEQQNLTALQADYLDKFCRGIDKVIGSVRNRLRWLEKEYQQQWNQT